MTDETAPKKLTNKQRVFINEYLKCFNASEAARRAGYSEKTAFSIGSENLRKPEIKAEIDNRLSDVHMGADEALKLLADMARGDIGDFMAISSVGYDFDLMAAREAGITKLIRKIKQKTTTRIGKKSDDDDIEVIELEIELYSAKDAIDTILKAGGNLKDNEITINVKLTDD
jgi:phage terminase small subunit